MSDIVIRGIEMPKSCGECPAIKSPAGFTGNTYYDGCYLDESLEVMAEERHENCPLVELPPHGALKDEMYVLNEIDRQFGENEKTSDIAQDIQSLIMSAPTILEASK